MESFKQFVEARGPSGKTQAMTDLVNAIKGVLKHYNPDTRKAVWEKLTSAKGMKEMNRLLRNPNAPVSQSDFNKLIQ
jgi:hypothetical protein